MSAKALAEKLQLAEQKCEDARNQLDIAYAAVIALIPPAADQWIVSEVEQSIKDHPDVVQSLGLEKLAELKAGLISLRERLPKLVQLAIGVASD
jgi:hypothetical protein